MKKFILFILLVVAGYLGYTYLWKPSRAPKETVSPPINQTTTQTSYLQPSPTNGISFYEQGKYKEAISRLEEEMKNQTIEMPERCLAYIAMSYERLEKPDKALKIWERIIKEYPQSIYCGDAYYEVGRRTKNREEKIKYLEKAMKFPESQGARMSGVELGDYYLCQMDMPDREYKARTSYSLALQSNISKEKISEIKGKLNELNKKLVFSSFPTQDSTIYTVKPGDTLNAISKKYKVEAGSENIALGHIRRINNLKSTNIHPNNKLKIITNPISARISKTTLTLTLYVNKDFIKEYPVGVGNPDKGNDTPVGTFTIGSKLIHPPWYKKMPDGLKEKIPYGDRRNVLGTRWIGFKESPQLGIHGTTMPETIGKKISDGCIRMYNQDVEEIYDLLSEGAKVIIED
jgi:lipoprotein-anchoring transpeptidase ErfK/SrfK